MAPILGLVISAVFVGLGAYFIAAAGSIAAGFAYGVGFLSLGLSIFGGIGVDRLVATRLTARAAITIGIVLTLLAAVLVFVTSLAMTDSGNAQTIPVLDRWIVIGSTLLSIACGSFLAAGLSKHRGG